MEPLGLQSFKIPIYRKKSARKLSDAIRMLKNQFELDRFIKELKNFKKFQSRFRKK